MIRDSSSPVTSVNPYLNLGGTVAAAIELYQSALGARLVRSTRFSEVPGAGPPELAERFIHAHLRIGGSDLMLSDAGAPPDRAAASPTSIALGVTSDDEVHRVYAALSEGGQAMVPPHPTPFGGLLGVLRDRFGVQWMVSSIPA